MTNLLVSGIGTTIILGGMFLLAVLFSNVAIHTFKRDTTASVLCIVGGLSGMFILVVFIFRFFF